MSICSWNLTPICPYIMHDPPCSRSEGPPWHACCVTPLLAIQSSPCFYFPFLFTYTSDRNSRTTAAAARTALIPVHYCTSRASVGQFCFLCYPPFSDNSPQTFRCVFAFAFGIGVTCMCTTPHQQKLTTMAHIFSGGCGFYEKCYRLSLQRRTAM